MALYEEGRITPVRPLEVVEATDIHRAFRLMQLGYHMGKLVVKMPESPREVVVSKSRLKLTLPDDVSYLLVGGLGGVGRALATMMVERGARHFVFLSRSAGKSAQDQAFRGELEAQGCSAVMIQGDVGVLDDVKAAIQHSSHPIGGVKLNGLLIWQRITLSQLWRTLTGRKVSPQKWRALGIFMKH